MHKWWQRHSNFRNSSSIDMALVLVAITFAIKLSSWNLVFGNGEDCNFLIWPVLWCDLGHYSWKFTLKTISLAFLMILWASEYLLINAFIPLKSWSEFCLQLRTLICFLFSFIIIIIIIVIINYYYFTNFSHVCYHTRLLTHSSMLFLHAFLFLTYTPFSPLSQA